MIAKDESLFVVMDALNQVRRHRSTEKALLHSHDVTDRVVASFSNTERLEYISLLHFFNNDVIFFLAAISCHMQTICVFMTIAQCQPHLG